MSLDLSIIIVNWNTRDLLAACLASLVEGSVQLQAPSSETFVVDNASADGSAAMVREKFPWATLIENQDNFGFARANNQGIRKARGRYMLLLNSDAALTSDTLSDLVSFMDREPAAGIAGVCLAFPHGSPQFCYGTFPDLRSEFRSLFGMHRWDLSPWGELKHPREVDWVSGACLMIRRTVVDAVGLLDEGFFMFGEEVDFCYRATQAGWKVYLVPSEPVTHVRAGSTGKTSERTLRLYRGKLRFASKHNSWVGRQMVAAMIWSSVVGKLMVYSLFSLARPRLASTRRFWWQVLTGL
jgi:GT2 family glycosyltransferase